MDQLNFRPLGDRAVRVGFGDEISLNIHRKIQLFCLKLKSTRHPAILEWVPSYTAVTIYYNQRFWTYKDVVNQVKNIASMVEEKEEILTPRVIRIPVCYGGKWGPDLSVVANKNSLAADEVIALHTAKKYLVYMIGFAPGFPYLGGLDPLIATPRKKEPRLHVPAGSVGIAGEQTGLYPLSTPGGWQIIGQTPLKLYNPEAENPTLLQAGDEIFFYSITPEEFYKIHSNNESKESISYL